MAEKLRTLENSGFGPIGQVHLALIQNIDFDGTRLTLAASRAQMTKQSMLELVDRAERLGLVVRRPDPGDGRARIIAFTPGGLQMMERLKDGIGDAERHMATIIGSAFMERMKVKLADYVVIKEKSGHTLPTLDARMAWRTHNIGRVLVTAFGVFTRDVQKTLSECGFAGVSEAHMKLFRNLDVHGTRPSEIAARARVTKQAMTELVRKTESLGLIKRARDPDDGRAQKVMLTSRGLQLLERTRIAVEQAEMGMEELVGTVFLAEMKGKLSAYVASVQSIDYGAVDVGGPASSHTERHGGEAGGSVETPGKGRSGKPQASRAMRVV